jgi:hypothetical protein
MRNLLFSPHHHFVAIFYDVYFTIFHCNIKNFYKTQKHYYNTTMGWREKMNNIK